MKCKDIPEKPILEFLATHGVCGPGTACNWCWPPNDVSEAFPPNTPHNLLMAKMKKMIEKGLVDGCYCGCRGDFKITDKGRSAMAGAQ